MNNYGYSSTDMLGGFAAIAGIVSIVSMAIGLISIISQWIIYKKAGKKGWEAIIPIYNMIVLLQIVELPMWYFILFFVPIANIYAIFKIYIELAHKFGKSTGFGIATVFFNIICLPILAFGKNNVYQGNNMNNNETVQSEQYIPDNNNNWQNQQNNISTNVDTLNNQNSNLINQSVNNNLQSETMNQNINNQINSQTTFETTMTPTQIFDTTITSQENNTNNESTPIGQPMGMFNQPTTNTTINNIQSQPFVSNQNMNNQMNQVPTFNTPTNAPEQPVLETQPQNTFEPQNQFMNGSNNQQQMLNQTINTAEQPFMPNQNNNPYNQNM